MSDWIFDDFDPGTQQIAGEKEFKKYSEFISGYVKQLSDIEEALDDSLGDTWDAVLDPITLQNAPYEHASLGDLIKTDHKILNKVMMVFASLCSEIGEHKEKAVNKFYLPLLMYGDGGGGEGDQDGESQMMMARMLDLLQDMSMFVGRINDLIKNTVEQLAALYSAEGAVKVINAHRIHLVTVFEHIGSALSILVTLDRIFEEGVVFKDHWQRYKRVLVSIKGATTEYNVDDAKLRSFERNVMETLEGKLMTGRIFEVYDVSAFVSKHPGGIDQIMVGAGRDITQLFKAYHKDVDFKRLMKKCCVGELVDNELPVFVTESNFYGTVRARVDGYLKQHKLDPKVDHRMFLTYCIVLASYFFCFYLMIFFHERFLFCCLFAGLSGALGTLTANTIYHDSSHFAITHRPWVWKLTSVVSASLLGTSMYIWRHQHVVGHHSYANIEGADPDIDTGPEASSGVWRIKTSQLPLPRFMYQHIYMPFLYTMLGIKMRTQDIPDIIVGMKDDIRLNPQSLSQWVEFCSTKVIHVIYRYFVPLLFMSLWEFIIASVLYEVVFSLYLAQVTQLNHVSDMVEWPKADSEKKIHVDWAELQVAATQDYCTDSWFWTFVTGALNHQTAHHLFPGFIQSHYSWITPLVKQTCVEYGVQYNSVGSFSEGLKLHYGFLWRMGQRASNKAL